MALQPIPTAWKNAVCEALKQGKERARFTGAGEQRLQFEFPNAFPADVRGAFIRALSDPGIEGCPVQMDSPPGETWEFFFQFEGEKLYGKILLRTDRRRVRIFSAHRPTKTRLHCE